VTDEERCPLTDLITWMCAHCLGHPDPEVEVEG
jgi:hypothetical protein